MEQKNLQIKYTNEDIERIFKKRVTTYSQPAAVKAGVICEWTFEYPNGQITADVEAAFCINPENNDFNIGIEVCRSRIKDKLWKICGQYSLATGEKL